MQIFLNFYNKIQTIHKQRTPRTNPRGSESGGYLFVLCAVLILRMGIRRVRHSECHSRHSFTGTTQCSTIGDAELNDPVSLCPVPSPPLSAPPLSALSPAPHSATPPPMRLPGGYGDGYSGEDKGWHIWEDWEEY